MMEICKEVVDQTVKELRAGGFDISDEEVRQAEQHCLRKIKVAGKGERYFEMLFPDVLREYLFRKTLNAISLLSMMEVEDVVRCVCKCESKELEEKKRQEEYEEQMRRINRLKEASMMDKKYREVTFDKYEVREENKKVFEMAKKYADRFQDMYKKNQGLLLYGPVGTGKSFTAACIGNYLLDNAKPVIMTSFVKILQDIWENDREAEYIIILNSASLLIVDDLGTERETDYALEKVYNIIDSRVRANKPMIITSNLELNDMMECEDMRLKPMWTAKSTRFTMPG